MVFDRKPYLLAVLLAIYVSNHVDRLALGLALQDIKADLALSDTQLGFLTGIAFALFYAVMGIPIARWADRGNRITIIVVTTALWSAAVALCAAAANFTQLLLIRVAVGVGEAGCVPPAHSLIADTFERSERPRAVSRYMLGDPLSIVIGFFLAGWLNEFYGWRTTFVLLGLPGLALAALTWITLREPRRLRRTALTAMASAGHAAASAPSLRHVFVTLWSNSAFRHLLFCFAVWYFFGYGLLQWEPTFFIRSHGLQSGEIGTWFAAIYGVGGALGVYVGGEWASRYAAGNERLQLNACAIAFAVFAVLTGAAFLTTNRYCAFGILALAAIGGSIAQGPVLATIQTLVPPQMRAMSLALIYLFANLIGLGLGPLTVGALSDTLRPYWGSESLRYALVLLCPGYFWAAWHLYRAGKTVARDVSTA